MNNNYSTSEQLYYALKRAKGIPLHINIKQYLDFASEVKSLKLRTAEDQELKRLFAGGEPFERFAAVCEASVRLLGLDPFPEQIAAGKLLSEKKLVQMQTGEGKTLAAVFPAVMAAAEGHRMHILTANEYLAVRDSMWMGRVYEFFGFSCSAVTEEMPAAVKQKAYKSQILYLTAKQAGFDYLHDCLQFRQAEIIQQPFDSCLVDEADFIMIDEARIPLVIAREKKSISENPMLFDNAAAKLSEKRHFRIDRAGRKCILTFEGINEVCRIFNVDETSAEGSAAVAGVNVALHARHLLKKGVDYIVRDGQIELIDGFTGRIAEKREWPYGIQRALEARERCDARSEGEICGSITISNFINLYPDKSAMTATAEEAAPEFFRNYGLETYIIKPHRDVKRKDLPDMIFRTVEAKQLYLLKLVKESIARNQPVLIGTATVMESKEVSGLLKNEGIRHKVLNAEQDAREAEIIAAAGRAGAVTVATNMAGRGTDILLGGARGEEAGKVKEAGGLFLISLNRFESKRVDNQLRGRSGRQGDPGTTVFLMSLEDELFKKYGIEEFLPESILSFSGDEPISSRKAAREIARAQGIIEDQHSKMRETLNNYSIVPESCRKQLVSDRKDALFDHKFPLPLIEHLEQESFSDFEAIDPSLAADIFAAGLDEFWTDFLEWNESVKEGIHLRRLGRLEPLYEYVRDVRTEFERGYTEMLIRSADRINRLFCGEEILSGEEKNGSTWTYLVDDNPFPSFRLSLLGMDSAVGAVAGSILLIFSPVLLINWISEKHGKNKRKKLKSNIKKV